MSPHPPLAAIAATAVWLTAPILPAAELPPGSPARTVPLWPAGAPGAVGNEEDDRPTLEIVLPAANQATGTAVVVCPGGGYGRLAIDHEGRQVARWLSASGVAALVLKYRHGPRYRHPAPLLDAQRAIRYVRTQAAELGLRPDRIGVWGFSAGGHLAATTATLFDEGDATAADPVDRASSRPDFAVLAYPVISLVEPFAHAGSRRNLLGESPDPVLLEKLSAERQVSARTPPTFIFYTDEDDVRSENGLAFYLALRKAGVPAELHVYEKGRHGLGLAPGDPVLSTWTERLRDWLRVRGLLQRAAGSLQ